MHHIIPAIAVSVGLGFVLSSTAQARGPMPNAMLETTNYVAEIQTVDCDINHLRSDSVVCLMATVPLYYEDVREDGTLPDEAPRIQVHAILLENFIVHSDPNPIVFIAGGPGQASSLMLNAASQALELRRTRGVLLIDQRGTGFSVPSLHCEDISPEELDDYRLNDPEIGSELSPLDRLAACAHGYRARGIDFSAFGTRSATLDFKAIRRGLGIEQWNLHGTSYGSRMVLDSLRVDPEGVRSAVVNSVQSVTPHMGMEHQMTRVALFEKLFDDCAADPGCSDTFGDLRADFQRIKDHLDAEEFQLFLRNPSAGDLVRVNVGWNDIVLGLYQHMSFTQTAEPVARYIHELARMFDGRLSLNDDEVARIFQHSLAEQNFGIAIGMHMAARCREDMHGIDEAAMIAAMDANPLYFPTQDIYSVYSTCDAWGAGTADGAFSEPVKSDIPTLILAGDVDPLTPLAWAERAAETLPNSQLVIFEGMAHDIYHSVGCARVVTANFLDNPLEALDTSCAEMSKPAFALWQ